jgi:hypothetical protein
MKDGSLTITALDPGGTTGVALYVADVIHNTDGVPEYYNEKWNTAQIGPEPHHKKLYQLLERWHVANTIVICENFQYRQHPEAPSVELVSVEYIGVAKLFAQVRETPILVMQETGKVIPPKDKNKPGGFWTDDKLKRVGRWSAGRKHANDAMRHLLHYMVFEMKRNDLLEPLK